MADHRKTNLQLWSDVNNLTYDCNIGIEYIAFSGGGAKGMAYLGVLKKLIEYDLLKGIKGFSGTSVGAIIAIIACCNLTICDIEKITETLDLSKLITTGNNSWLSTPSKLFNIFSNLGIENGVKIVEYLENLLEEFGFERGVTFREFSDLTGKDVKLMSVNLTKQEQYVFSADTTPNETVIKGIRASIAIPYIFTPVQKDSCSSDLLVDGAILNNCPIDLFDKKGFVNNRAIGFTFTRCGGTHDEIQSLQSYTKALIETMLSSIDLQHQNKPFFWTRVVPIDCGDIKDSLYLTPNESIKLFKIGELSMDIFLKQRIKLIEENGGFPKDIMREI